MAKKYRQVSEIRSECESIQLEIKELQSLIRAKNDRIAKLNDEIDRVQIIEAIGIPNGVRLRHHSKLDSALGIVLKVSRINATVDFGSELGGEGEMPIRLLLSVASGRAREHAFLARQNLR